MRLRMGLSGAALLLAAGMFGCASHHEEGVTSNYHSQWTDVAADPKTTTAAARAVLEGSDLKDVTSSSTEIDGTASGAKADGTKVKVDIEKKDAGSKVSVTVGTLGDPSLGAEYAAKIKAKAEAK